MTHKGLIYIFFSIISNMLVIFLFCFYCKKKICIFLCQNLTLRGLFIRNIKDIKNRMQIKKIIINSN